MGLLGGNQVDSSSPARQSTTRTFSKSSPHLWINSSRAQHQVCRVHFSKKPWTSQFHLPKTTARNWTLERHASHILGPQSGNSEQEKPKRHNFPTKNSLGKKVSLFKCGKLRSTNDSFCTILRLRETSIWRIRYTKKEAHRKEKRNNQL